MWGLFNDASLSSNQNGRWDKHIPTSSWRLRGWRRCSLRLSSAGWPAAMVSSGDRVYEPPDRDDDRSFRTLSEQMALGSPVFSTDICDCSIPSCLRCFGKCKCLPVCEAASLLLLMPVAMLLGGGIFPIILRAFGDAHRFYVRFHLYGNTCREQCALHALFAILVEKGIRDRA